MRLSGGIICYAAGLAIAPFLYWHNVFFVLPFIAAALAFVALRPKQIQIIFTVFLFTLGLNNYHLTTDKDLFPYFEQLFAARSKIVVEGTIDAMNSRPENGLSVELTSVAVGNRGRVDALPGRVRIYIDQNSSELRPGDRVKIYTALRQPRNFAIPGQFDYVRYLNRRNIVATGYTREATDFSIIARDVNWTPVLAIKKWRSRIREQLFATLDEKPAALVNALATGDRGAVSPEQRKLLAESGLAHLFAISGLHVGLIAAMLYFLLRAIYLRIPTRLVKPPPRRVLAPVLMPILFGYMILTGSAISTGRALIMLSAAVILCCLSRRSRPLDTLAAAGFIILTFDPLALFEPSFQLSFAGAAGIIAMLPLWQPKLAGKPILIRYPLGLLAVNLSATLTTTPFILMHFHTLAYASPLLNMLAVPLIAFIVVPLILAASFASLFSTQISTLLFELASEVVVPFFSFCDQIISTDLLRAEKAYLSPATIAAVMLAVFAITFMRNTLNIKRIILGILAIGLLTILPALSNSDRKLTVTALDVGQGDSTLVQIPDNSSYLIDGGGLYSDRFDVGEKLLAPALGFLGVKQLDAVILTHDHPDHRKGLVYILKHFTVREFWCAIPQSELHPTLREPLTEKKIKCRQFLPGWTDVHSRSGTMKVFVAAGKLPDKNDRSLVVFSKFKNDGVLLTGDLETTGINELAMAPSPGPVTLLKIPHHGSRNSDPTLLFRKFGAETSFVSVGYNNRYRHPHPSIVNKINNIPSQLFRTDSDGSMRFASKGTGWAITHWKKGLFR